MALDRISNILAQMRGRTAEISAVARAEEARQAAERAARALPRPVIIVLGGAHGGMKKERCCK